MVNALCSQTARGWKKKEEIEITTDWSGQGRPWTTLEKDGARGGDSNGKKLRVCPSCIFPLIYYIWRSNFYCCCCCVTVCLVVGMSLPRSSLDPRHGKKSLSKIVTWHFAPFKHVKYIWAGGETSTYYYVCFKKIPQRLAYIVHT